MTGKPLDRHAVWKMLKGLRKSARVSRDKVFPHNLRHLFARTFYSVQKDIVRLADILGHSGIETRRIYTMEAQWKRRNSSSTKRKIRAFKMLKNLCHIIRIMW